jgi:hypothetical protein
VPHFETEREHVRVSLSCNQTLGQETICSWWPPLEACRSEASARGCCNQMKAGENDCWKCIDWGAQRTDHIRSPVNAGQSNEERQTLKSARVAVRDRPFRAATDHRMNPHRSPGGARYGRGSQQRRAMKAIGRSGRWQVGSGTDPGESPKRLQGATQQKTRSAEDQRIDESPLADPSDRTTATLAPNRSPTAQTGFVDGVGTTQRNGHDALDPLPLLQPAGHDLGQPRSARRLRRWWV